MRYRNPKPGELVMQWSKKENDVVYHNESPAHGGGRRLLHYYCGQRPEYNFIEKRFDQIPSLFDALDKLGYDVTTLKFSIQKKAEVTPAPSTTNCIER